MYVHKKTTRAPGRHMNDSFDFSLDYVTTRKLFENICLRVDLNTWKKKNVVKVIYNTGI